MSTVPRQLARRSGARRARVWRSRRAASVTLGFEILEDRVVLSTGDSLLHPVPLSFPVSAHIAVVTEYLSDPNGFVINQVQLDAGDVVRATIDTSRYGASLNSYLRVFHDFGTGVQQIASNDNLTGLDAGLTFQAPEAGAYFIGISSAGDTDYDPTSAGSGHGSSKGMFDLSLFKTNEPLAPKLVSASFSIDQTTAVTGDQVTVHYAVENRAGSDAGPFTLALVPSGDNRFDDSMAALDSTLISGLAAGDHIVGQFTVALPDFNGVPRIFLGLGIDAVLPVSGAQGNDWAPLVMLKAETDVGDESNTSLASALPIDLNSRIGCTPLPAGDADYFQLTSSNAGNLTAQVDADGAPVTLTLYTSDGVPIVQSNGVSAADHGPLVMHGLLGNATYYLKVENLGAACEYQLTTLMTASASQLYTIPIGATDTALAKGDFDGDGRIDLITANQQYPDSSQANNATVLLSNGDGTFQNAGSFSLGITAQALAVGDFNGDGRLDLLASTAGTDDIRLLLGNGAGGFAPAATITGPGGTSLAVGDFNSDGNLDFAVADTTTDRVAVYLGDGQGNFVNSTMINVTGVPSGVAAGDFNGDGKPDLVVSQRETGQVAVLLGKGDGTFQDPQSFDAGSSPVAIVAADFNGDGRLDVAVANSDLAGRVTVLFGNGQGTLTIFGSYAAGNQPGAIVTADFNADGKVDLAAANAYSNDVTVLMNKGAGVFRLAGPVNIGANPSALAADDFDGDGRVDVAAANFSDMNVNVLAGGGDGTFAQIGTVNRTQEHPDVIVQGDFNGDGKLDIATANYDAASVTILLGQGDGTFVNAGAVATGTRPDALVTGDFNGDGRLDLAVADRNSADPGHGDVMILLGQGDGTFLSAGAMEVNGLPTALAAADFDENGTLDLAVALGFNPDASPGSTVVLLFGDGHGAFPTSSSVTVGSKPMALVVGDFNHDHHLDLAVADAVSQDVTVLLGRGDGTFRDGIVTPVGAYVTALVAGDFHGDGNLDLAATGQAYLPPYYTPASQLVVLLGQGDGTFQTNATQLDASVNGLATGDFNGDGISDLALADGTDPPYFYIPSNRITVYLGNGSAGRGDGTFQKFADFAAENRPTGIVTGDFNNDFIPDLAGVNFLSSQVTVLMGSGSGDFLAPAFAPSPVQSTPLIANLSQGPVTDAVVLTATGQILYRQGLSDQPGAFGAPVVINPDPALAARAIAVVSTLLPHPSTYTPGMSVSLLAAVEAKTGNTTDNPFAGRTIDFYQPVGNGQFVLQSQLGLTTSLDASDIASADLNGDGLGDVVVSIAANNEILVAMQIAPGVFVQTNAQYFVGVTPSAIDLVDVNGDGRPDIVVADRYSGQMSVLINDGHGAFGPEERFRANTGPYALTTVNGVPVVQSLAGTNGVVAGTFDGAPGIDLIALNGAAGNFALLSGDTLDGFRNPQAAQTFSTGGPATAIVAGNFITGDPSLDLAVLSCDTGLVTIYRGDGQGNFQTIFSTSVGNQPTGLSVADVSRPDGGGPDGIKDLLIGNQYGDLLILTGKGDGTFSEYRRAGQKVALATTMSAATSQTTFFFSDHGNDQLSYQTVAAGAATVSGAAVFQDRSAGILAPGPETVVTVAGTQYLVVANGGANQILIYTLGADGQPIVASKQTYFTGTDPVSLTVTTPANDLNHDAVPDLLVANHGSNDVSVFVGQMSGPTWTLAYRPRQSSAGIGPTSVTVGDVFGPDSRDLLVSNGGSNDVTVLPSRGDGYFINQDAASALVFNTGNNPIQVFVGNYDGLGGLDLVTINADSGNVTLISDYLSAEATTSTTGSGGATPTAAIPISLLGNGVNDLLVANADNGALELLHGGAAGFEVVATFFPGATPHLSDLALVTAGNRLDLYGTDAGTDVAILLASFGPPVAPPFFPTGPGISESPILPADLPAFTSANAGTSAVFVDFGPGTIVPGNAALEALLSALTVTIQHGADTSFYTGPTTPPPVNQDDVLLLNLGDPAGVPTRPNPPIVPQNPEEGGASALLREADPSKVASALDSYWQAAAEELQQVAVPLAEASPRRQSSLPLPGQVLEAVVVHSVVECDTVAEKAITSIPTERPAVAAALTGFWYALPLLAAELLNVVRTPVSRARVALRRLWQRDDE